MERIANTLSKLLIIAGLLLPIKIAAQLTTESTWKVCGQKLKFCFEKNPSFQNDFARILKSQDAWDLHLKMESVPNDSIVARKLLIGLCDLQANRAFFAKPAWAIKEMLKMRLYFTPAEIEFALDIYETYLEEKSIAQHQGELFDEQEIINKWLTNGKPTITEFNNPQIIRPNVTINNGNLCTLINEYDCLIEQKREYKALDYAGYYSLGVSKIDVLVDDDGSVSEVAYCGPLNIALQKSQILINAPARYKFERLDTIINVPSKISLKIKEFSSITAIVTAKTKYKNSNWAIEILDISESHIPHDNRLQKDNYIHLITTFLASIGNKYLQKGSHTVRFELSEHWIELNENRFYLNPFVRLDDSIYN